MLGYACIRSGPRGASRYNSPAPARPFDPTNRWKNRPTIHPAPGDGRRSPSGASWRLIVGVPSVVALDRRHAGVEPGGHPAYHRAQVLEQANASSSSLIQAAATQAKERGFTAAALSDASAETARRAILDLRTRGDGLLDAALDEAQSSLRGNAVLTAAHAKLLEARRARDLKRGEVDGALLREQTAPQGLVQDWFDTQTRLIGAEQVFGSTLFLAQNPLRAHHPVQWLHQGQRLCGQRVRRA